MTNRQYLIFLVLIASIIFFSMLIGALNPIKVNGQTGVQPLYTNYVPIARKDAGYISPTPTPIQPTPEPTTTIPPVSTPYPSPTPGSNYNYIVQRIYRLNACENHGMLRAFILVYDKTGVLLDGIKVVRWTNTGDYAGEAITGSKGPGAAEFSLEAENGGNWHFVIDMPGQSSETAWNIRTDLGLWEECNGEPGVYFKHISYDIQFIRVSN